MYNLILVPLDGSKRAETILPYVEDLAQSRGSRILLLEVIEPSTSMVTPYDMVPYYDAELMQKWIEEAKGYVETIQTRLRDKGIDCRGFVEQGPVVRTVLEVAEREGADLIAMASHGRSGLARVFYGSVAAGILQQADRPLLLVRAIEA
jgi:nucleotide-binding universal stress UspA family protein